MSDSAQARFTTFEVPGLMMTPVPSGALTAADRSQFNDLYAGIAASAPVSTVIPWIKYGSKTGSWVSAKQPASTWVPEKEESQTWDPEKGGPR